jgi:hypothetical protein
MDSSVRIQSKNGDSLVRENLIVAFFGLSPFAKMVDGGARCVDRYLKMVPNEALSWSLIGTTASTHKPANAKDIAKCRALLTASTAKQKDIHFRLMGPDKWGPDYRLLVNGLKAPSQEGFLNQTNGIEMLFPVEFLASVGEDAFVEAVKKMFESLQCDSGHAGIALVPGPPSDYTEAARHIAPLLMRSHGLDIGITAFEVNRLGDRCRGARWLTMLSDKLVDEVGGRRELAGKLAKGVTVVPCTHGVMMRAGKTPEIGDVNRQQVTPLLASVAQAIEGVTLFQDNALLQFFGNNPEMRDRWERRFWWQTSTMTP